MSNRYTHNKNEGSRGAFNPRKQQFVPKNPNSSAQKLSDSLRHSDSGAVASSATAGNRLTRKDGASVPNQTRSGNFVKYLPHDEAVASGLAADVDWILLSRNVLSICLIENLAGDTSLHDFLESFLKSRTRWYDFPYRGARGIVAGTIVGEYELSRRVYMVLYRISSSRDPGAKAGDSLSPKDHAEEKAVKLRSELVGNAAKVKDITRTFKLVDGELTYEVEMATGSVSLQPHLKASLKKL
ncbi:hypothetical protein ACET3Z_019883 [Daucus carota]